MKTLVNAYACCPNMGSEPGMAWNWCVNLAQYCELHIVTEGEFRDRIEKAVEELPQGKNMHFYYNPVSEMVRRMCWNQGDWRFYWHYRKWQKRTADIAREICKRESIEVLHQLNMIGFHEPGCLWKVSKELSIPFIWGPIGGLKQYPLSYAENAGWKVRCFLWLKNKLNRFHLHCGRNINEAFNQASFLISSIPDSYLAIRKCKGLESIIIPETGTFICERQDGHDFSSSNFTILWVGKFDYRKRLDIAIKAVAKAKESCPNISLKVYGTGSDVQVMKAALISHDVEATDFVMWEGNQPNELVNEEMGKAHLFLFTSVNEDTSTVVLEAVSNGLPVLCFDVCGMSSVINEDIGFKIALTNPEQSIKDFAEKITFLYYHRDVLRAMSENCATRAKELSWDNKAKQVVALYQKAVEKGV